MIIFNYKNHNYELSFFPCGNLLVIKKDTGKIAREIKYSSGVKFSDFLKRLEKINFCEV